MGVKSSKPALRSILLKQAYRLGCGHRSDEGDKPLAAFWFRLVGAGFGGDRETGGDCGRVGGGGIQINSRRGFREHKGQVQEPR